MGAPLPTPAPGPTRYRGTSLVEVLVAMVLLGVGVLCAGRLQAATATGLSEAEQRYLASQLATDLLGRARARTLDTSSGQRETVSCDGESRCDTPLWTSGDLARWRSLLAGEQVQIDGRPVGGLVEPAFCIDAEPITGGWELELTLSWRGRTAYANAEPNVAACGPSTTPDQPRRTLTRRAFIAAPAG